jgi:hypothetical protein
VTQNSLPDAAIIFSPRARIRRRWRGLCSSRPDDSARLSPKSPIRGLDDERARRYGDLVLNSLNESARRALKAKKMKG